MDLYMVFFFSHRCLYSVKPLSYKIQIFPTHLLSRVSLWKMWTDSDILSHSRFSEQHVVAPALSCIFLYFTVNIMTLFPQSTSSYIMNDIL